MNTGLADFKSTYAHLLETVRKPDARVREMLEAVTHFKRHDQEIEIDKSFYAKEGIPTFLFVDGDLVSQPKLSGIALEVAENFEFLSSKKNRTNALTFLHHSMMGVMYELNIEKNLKLEQPIRILKLSTSGQIVFPTLMVRAGRFSQVTLIEESISIDKNNVSVGETHLQVEDGAQLEHIMVQTHHSDSKSSMACYASLSKDALYKNFCFHLKGALTQTSLDLHIEASGAHGESHALYLTNGSEKSLVDTVIQHYCPDATSAQLAKGILDHDSQGTFTGRIHIHPDAQRVNSSQLNKNLLLSKKARVFSEPQLEIFADDVKCSHGSTTGQLSPEEVFYFEARGIPHDKARNLLALGFGMEVVMKISEPTARQYLIGLVGTELKNKFHLGGVL